MKAKDTVIIFLNGVRGKNVKPRTVLSQQFHVQESCTKVQQLVEHGACIIKEQMWHGGIS